MKVYLVTCVDDYDASVFGVYTTGAEAEKARLYYVKEEPEYRYLIQEWEVQTEFNEDKTEF